MSEKKKKEKINDELRDIAKERDLARISESIDSKKKYCTWGVVLDRTDAFKKDDNTKYAMKLKVIDESFNFSTKLKTKEIKFQNYATIFIYSEDEDDVPIIASLGDIIRIRRFIWTINDKGELIGRGQKFSNWMTFNIQTNDFKISSSFNIQSNVNRRITEYEQNHLKKLRNWTLKFFGENTIRRIAWWSSMFEVSDNYSQTQAEDFVNVDLVLKITEINNDQNVITYIDEKENYYIHEIKEKCCFKVGYIVKIRGAKIRVTGSKRKLFLEMHTTMLMVHPEFFDAKIFDKTFYEENKEKLKPVDVFFKFRRNNDNFPTKKSVLAIYPFLKDYYFEEHIIEKRDLMDNAKPNQIISKDYTILKKDYCNKIPTLLSTFLTNNIELLKKLNFNKFVLDVRLVDADLKPFKDMFFTYCKICRVSKYLKSTHDFRCCKQLVKLSFFLKLYCVDDSIQDSKQMPVYILAKKESKNPFSLWQVLPDFQSLETFCTYTQSEFDKFNTKIQAIIKSGISFKIIVETKQTTDGKFYLEMRETMFLP